MSYMHFEYAANVSIDEMLRRVNTTERAIDALEEILKDDGYIMGIQADIHFLLIKLVSQHIKLEEECQWKFANDYFMQKTWFNQEHIIFRVPSSCSHHEFKTEDEALTVCGDAAQIQAVVVQIGYDVL